MFVFDISKIGLNQNSIEKVDLSAIVEFYRTATHSLANSIGYQTLVANEHHDERIKMPVNQAAI